MMHFGMPQKGVSECYCNMTAWEMAQICGKMPGAPAQKPAAAGRDIHAMKYRIAVSSAIEIVSGSFRPRSDAQQIEQTDAGQKWVRQEEVKSP